MDNSFLNSLRKGGFIFYVKHGEATVGSDLPNLNFQDCLTQRNLSELGRRQAIYYGEMIQYLQVPIRYPVSASPLCRAIETAQLAFGSGNVQVNPYWFEVFRLSGNLPIGDRQSILNYLQSVLEIIPEEGENKVIVSHSFPEGVGLGPLADMETAIIKPRGAGMGYEVVRKLSLADWSKL